MLFSSRKRASDSPLAMLDGAEQELDATIADGEDLLDDLEQQHLEVLQEMGISTTPETPLGDNIPNEKPSMTDKIDLSDPTQAAEVLIHSVGHVTREEALLEGWIHESWSKIHIPLPRYCIRCFLGGLYIAVGCHLFLVAGGDLAGSLKFPTGMMPVVLTEAEIFSGDSNALLARILIYFGWLEKPKSWHCASHSRDPPGVFQWMRRSFLCWFFNVTGALFWALIIAYTPGYASGTVIDADDDAVNKALRLDPETIAFAKETARAHAEESPFATLLNSIGGGFLIALALRQASCCTNPDDLTSKILAVYFPVSAFIMLQLEHVLTNSFFLLLGVWLKAQGVTTGRVSQSLVLATIGNVLGAAVTHWVRPANSTPTSFQTPAKSPRRPKCGTPKQQQQQKVPFRPMP